MFVSPLLQLLFCLLYQHQMRLKYLQLRKESEGSARQWLQTLHLSLQLILQLQLLLLQIRLIHWQHKRRQQVLSQ